MERTTEYSDLTIVIPTYNEAGNIVPLIKAIKNSLQGVYVVVIDDQSKDGTADIALEAYSTDEHVKIVKRVGKPQLTGSISDGVSLATTSYVGWLDADFSHPPELFVLLFEGAKKTGCAIATRFADETKETKGQFSDNALASTLSLILNIFVKRILNINITDYTSGFIICRNDFLKIHKFIGDYGEYFIHLCYHLSTNKILITEIPYVSPPRTWGESKTGASFIKISRRGIKYLWMTLRLVFHKIFGVGLPLAKKHMILA